MTTSRTRPALLAIFLLLLLAAFGNGCSSCRKDEPAPPMPEITEPSASPPSTVVLVPPIEDAGDEGDSAADAKPPGKPGDFTSLRNCCASLAANAASMPPPQNLYAANAAAFCSAGVNAVNTPGAKDQLLAGIRNAMRGAAMPPACH